MESLWTCPVCAAALTRAEGRFLCPAGHAFDVAREGYVNLVLAHQRRSAASGDPPTSVRQRRAFLEAGHYAPLAAALQRIVAELTAATPAPVVLDAGCGEGYYLRRLAAALPAAQLHGVDVAKEGVRLAARASPAIAYAVANTYHLPVGAASVDGVVQVFAPSSPEQLRRVLRPVGWFVRVTPGPQHLASYRGRIYPRAQPHAPVAPPAGFAVRAEERVRFALHLEGAEAVAQLVEMTPYKWHMDPETAAAAAGWTELTDTADFAVTVAIAEEERP